MTSEYRNAGKGIPGSHGFNKTILDAQSDFILRLKPDTTIIYVNEVFAKFYGFDVKEITGKKWFDLLPPGTSEKIRSLIDPLTLEDPVGQTLIENERYDGLSCWISWISTGIFNTHGRLTDVLIVGHDNTERFETERNLIESLDEISQLKLKFETVADFTNDLERWVLEDGTILYISPSCERITGYSQAEFMNTPKLMDSLVLTEDLQIWESRPYNDSVSDIPFQIEYRIRRKDGQIRWMHTIGNLVVTKTGQNIGMRSSTRDITERKNMELKLVQANNSLIDLNERYTTIAEFTSNMERWVLPDGTLAFISPSCERLTGYTREEFMADPGLFESIIKMGDHKTWNSVMAELNEDQSLPEVEFRIRHKDGQIRWLSTSVSSVVSPDGKHLGIRTSTHDITKRKNAEIVLQMAFNEIKEMQEKLEQENLYLRDKVMPVNPSMGFHFSSSSMTEVMSKISQVAVTDSPVLITGETGTGKELIANAIHQQSKRSGHAMIVVNCSALPPSLIESELFGRERGAYTGAIARQIGRFELADKSTLFLDEIGDLPTDLQVKLLRVLQFGEYQLLGSPHTQKVDVRIIAATNRDLQAAMEAGAFRSDLFFRLNVFPIHVAPLRERKEDIPSLVWSIIEEKMASLGKRIDKVSKKSMEMLMQYNWPGNIRELQNVVEYSLILCKSPTLEVQMPAQTGLRDKETPKTLGEAERQHIEAVLKICNGRIRGKNGAAEILGLNESTLRFRMKKLGIR
jgi:PAS domain S-box-containing protein